MPIPLNGAPSAQPGQPEPAAAPRQVSMEMEVKDGRALAATLPAWDLVPPAQLLSFRRRGA